MKMLAFCAALLAFASPAHAETVYVHAGKLVDVVSGSVRSNQRIEIDGERIVAVTPWQAPPSGARIIDWHDLTVLPGLIDLHTHVADIIQGSDVAEPIKTSPAETAFIGVSQARATLEAGFTSVRDVGTYRAFADVKLRNAINRGLVVGPRMFVVGAYLTIPGGGGEINGLPAGSVPDDIRFGLVRDDAEAARKAEALFAGGVDLLKMMATGAVLAIGTEPGQPELTESEMRAAVAVATTHRSHATAHAHGAEGIAAAIRAGARSIEHASLIDDATLAQAKAAGTWLVMDIYNGDWIEEIGTREKWPAEYLRKNRETTDVQREGFAKAVKLGVRIGYGTDAGVYPHGLNARQFAYMVRYGMTPMQAIRSATVDAAELLDRRADLGSIEPGRFADMIAVAGDPLADIRVLESVKHVVKSGQLIK